MAEQTYSIPLRREFSKAPRYMRAKKAVSAVKEFMSRHLKSDDIVIGSYLNRKLWEHGIKNPPHHVEVTAFKDDKGAIKVELVGAPKEEKKVEKGKKEKKEVKKESKEKLKEIPAAAATEKIKEKTEPKEQKAAEEEKKTEKIMPAAERS